MIIDHTNKINQGEIIFSMESSFIPSRIKVHHSLPPPRRMIACGSWCKTWSKTMYVPSLTQTCIELHVFAAWQQYATVCNSEKKNKKQYATVKIMKKNMVPNSKCIKTSQHTCRSASGSSSCRGNVARSGGAPGFLFVSPNKARPFSNIGELGRGNLIFGLAWF